jgi:hypothetical protein
LLTRVEIGHIRIRSAGAGDKTCYFLDDRKPMTNHRCNYPT